VEEKLGLIKQSVEFEVRRRLLLLSSISAERAYFMRKPVFYHVVWFDEIALWKTLPKRNPG
jgi:hypothetical protein